MGAQRTGCRLLPSSISASGSNACMSVRGSKQQHSCHKLTHCVAVDEAAVAHANGSENERVAIVGVRLQPGVPGYDGVIADALQAGVTLGNYESASATGTCS